VSFEFSKQIFHWNNLNRKDYLKFAKKLNKKQLKSYPVKKFQRKKLFMSQLTAHSLPARVLPCAVLSIGRSPLYSPLTHGPWPAGEAAQCLCPSDGDRTVLRDDRPNKMPPERSLKP
jgi:hypothetical protein